MTSPLLTAAEAAGSALAALSSIYLNELLSCAEALQKLDPNHPTLKRLS